MSGAPGRRPGRPGRLPSLRVPALFFLVLLTGCRLDVAVEVEAGRSGGGQVRATVTLDEAAAAQVPDLAAQLRVEDLRSAGWRVEGPTPTSSGGTTVRASKPFASPAGAGRAIEELGVPLAGLRFATDRTLWKTKSSLRGTVDLTAGLDAFGDQALTERLGGPGLGLDPDQLERDLGRPVADLLKFEVVARLPGDVDSNAPATRKGAAVWPVELGRSVSISASSEAWNVVNIALVAVSVLAGLALVVVLVRRSRAVSWG